MKIFDMKIFWFDIFFFLRQTHRAHFLHGSIAYASTACVCVYTTVLIERFFDIFPTNILVLTWWIGRVGGRWGRMQSRQLWRCKRDAKNSKQRRFNVALLLRCAVICQCRDLNHTDYWCFPKCIFSLLEKRWFLRISHPPNDQSFKPINSLSISHRAIHHRN